MILEPWQWALAVVCAVLNGVAKCGVPGLGIFAVVLMLYVIPNGRLSAGAVLPMLCVADVFAVLFFHRHAHWAQIARLSPWVGAGLGLGAAVLYYVSDDVITPLMGGVILIMLALHALRMRAGAPAVAHRWWTAAVFGILAGGATTIANAAGPVMSLYLLSMALPKEEFMGTSAWFYFIINLVKLPIFLLPDQSGQARITADTLLLDAWMVPAIIVGALVGRRIFTQVPQRAFEWLVLVLSFLGAVKLLIPVPMTAPAAPPAPAMQSAPATPPAASIPAR
jgi:uncharacterized membrane protein YfcA